jgi:hypothetical protein
MLQGRACARLLAAPPGVRAGMLGGVGARLDSLYVYVYGPRMPNVTVYLPPDLHLEVKRHDLNVSKVCQNALRRKVRMAHRGDVAVRDSTGRVVGVARGPGVPDDPAA